MIHRRGGSEGIPAGITAHAPVIIPNPLDLGGLVVWLVASDATGGGTYTWPNRGTLGNWTQSTAGNQPATPVSWQGQQAVTFTYPAADATKDWLDGPSLAALTAGHAYVVMQKDADPSTAGDGVGGLWLIGTDALASHVPFSDGTIFDDFGSTARKATVNPTASLASPCIYETISTSSEWTNFLNGGQLFTTGTNTVAFSATPRIGADATGNNVGMSGKIGEVIVFDHKLTNPQRSGVLQYLSNKYTISVTLP